jgi:hypothetical protein
LRVMGLLVHRHPLVEQKNPPVPACGTSSLPACIAASFIACKHPREENANPRGERAAWA